METLPAPVKKTTLFFGVLSLLILLFAFAFSSKAIMLVTGIHKANAEVFLCSRLLFWTSLLYIYFFATKIEKQKVLLWQEKKYLGWEYLVSVIAIFFALIVSLAAISFLLLRMGFQKESAKFNEMLVIFEKNNWLIFLTAITAGIVEEFTFRGYLLPRMALLFKSEIAAVIVSSLLFGLLHFGYGTMFQLVGPFVIGFIFAVYYWKFRNIKVIIFCHILWDLMAIYLKILMKDFGK